MPKGLGKFPGRIRSMMTLRTDRIGPQGLAVFCWCAGLLFLVAGCQTPPGQLSGCNCHSSGVSRKRVLAKQLLCDTAEEVSHHPLRAGRTLLADQAGWFGSVSRGVFGKRLAMRLHGAPPPLSSCPAIGQ